MMNFLNLHYFLTLADELNFTRAAKRLYISQQALSKHISRLERDLNAVLFNRQPPLTLTQAGRSLARYAALILDLKEQSARELADLMDFKSGDLYIGVSHTRGRAFLPEILPLYNGMFPGISLHLFEGNSQELNTALLLGRVDLIVGLLPFGDEAVTAVPLCNEQILMAVPDSVLLKYFPGNHAEIKDRLNQNADIKLLRDCPFLMVKADNSVRIIADGIFEENGIKPRIVLETENIETVLALAVKGMGVTFYPKTLMRNKTLLLDTQAAQSISLYQLPCRESHGTLGLGYKNGRYLPRSAAEFIELAKQIYDQ